MVPTMVRRPLLAAALLLALVAVAAIGVDAAGSPLAARLHSRFRTQWTDGRLLPKCTSELTGATTAVINPTLRSSIDFNPAGATNPCGTDGGNNPDATATSTSCQVSCRPGFINTKGGLADLTCDSSVDAEGVLSLDGFDCQGPQFTGVSHMEVIAVSAKRDLQIMLDVPAAGSLLIDINCLYHYLPLKQFTVASGAQ